MVIYQPVSTVSPPIFNTSCSTYMFNFAGSFHLVKLHLQFVVSIVHTYYAFPSFSLSSRDLVLTYWLPELDMLEESRKGTIIFLFQKE